MRALRSPAFLAGVVSAIAAPLMAAAYVRARHGFGAGDLTAFAFWSVGLGALLAAALPLAYGRVVRLPRAGRAALGAACGAVTGIIFTLTLAVGMGPWIGTFSFPILYIWAAAAALGAAVGVQLVTVARAERQTWRKLRRSIGVALGVLAITAVAPFGLLWGSVYLWNRAEPEIHLLPAGFSGPVVILFDQATGAVPKREGRARVYEIPASGQRPLTAPTLSGAVAIERSPRRASTASCARSCMASGCRQLPDVALTPVRAPCPQS